MPDPLQSAEFKLWNAHLFLQEMGNDLMPQSLTSPMAAAMESSGAIVGSPWQQGEFWAHLDAFLAMARSVPDVIQWWCGFDPYMKSADMKTWLSKISSAELNRRRQFQAKFERHCGRFRKLPLSRARRFSVHVRGTPAVSAKITGRWGMVYTGGPTEPLPSTEFRQIVARDDTALQWAATQSPTPLEAMPSDFRRMTAANRRVRTPLLRECQNYLRETEKLIQRARNIFQRVNGGSTVTPPPLI